MPGKSVPICDVDPFAPDVLACPYPAYARIREAGPVVRLERYGVWASARYSVVRAALLDHETFSSAAGTGLADLRTEQGWRSRSLLQEADPPEHTRARRVVGSVLSPGEARRMRDPWAAQAEEMVAELVGAGEFDGVARLAQALPLRVFADAVGLPVQGRTENLPPFADLAFNAFGPPNALREQSMRGASKVMPWVVRSCYPDRLSPDGWGAQIHRLAAAEGFSLDEAAVLVRSLLAAGMDTTVKGIGTVLLCLATHPEQYAMVRADPALARAAFEEAVRLESPIQLFFRTVTRDTELDGVRLPAGEKILLLFGAANRDPRRWDRPEQFDIHRRTAGHLGFGAGIHTCVGRVIAYLEAEALLTALVRRAGAIRLVGEPRWQPNNALRGLAELPLKLPAVG